ncbi:MAG: hypothetical protein ABSF99_03845 [Anaerolineales bacterium]
MRKNLFKAAILLGLSLLLMSCQVNTNPQTNSKPAGSPGKTQSVPQATSTSAALDQSAVNQAEQSLNDLQNTLQSIDTNVNSVNITQIDQSLNDLQNSLAATDVPIPTPDTLDQDLNSLQQTLQAQPMP